MFKTNNPILQTDSYKIGHSELYPKKLESVYSYLEARKDIDQIVFFGALAYKLQSLVTKITHEMVDEAERYCEAHFGSKSYFNRSIWEYIIEKYDGKLPLEIKAVPEGTVLPGGNVLMTIEPTDDKVAALVNNRETKLMHVWYPITIATRSFLLYQKLTDIFKMSTDGLTPDFAVHDFGYRGVPNDETAAVGGAAHLLSFMGTDTMIALTFINDYYNHSDKLYMAGYSVPATEHSVMCSFGGKDYEVNAVENAINKFPNGFLSLVADTWNIYNFADNIIGQVLKDKVMARNGKLVVRPDSGNPIEVICGRNYVNGTNGTELEDIGLLGILYNRFGGTKNSKGYIELDPHVGIIQGDGMNPDAIVELYNAVLARGFSASCIVTGSGGGLLQKVDRDTLSFAIKASQVTIDGEEFSISKDPITSKGSKKSKKGRLKLVKDANGKFTTVSSNDVSKEEFDALKDELVTVFKNGEIMNMDDFETIKARMKSAL